MFRFYSSYMNASMLISTVSTNTVFEGEAMLRTYLVRSRGKLS